MKTLAVALLAFLGGVAFARIWWAPAIWRLQQAERWARGEVSRCPDWLFEKIKTL